MLLLTIDNPYRFQALIGVSTAVLFDRSVRYSENKVSLTPRRVEGTVITLYTTAINTTVICQAASDICRPYFFSRIPGHC